jgi:hypothetical protein
LATHCRLPRQADARQQRQRHDPPTRRTTLDGFELQFGTNYLGTCAHCVAASARAGARRVTTYPAAHRIGRINFDDRSESTIALPPLRPVKLANLMFASSCNGGATQGWGLCRTPRIRATRS